jgi:hypothetical protein
MHPRLLSNLIGVAAIVCLVVGVAGLIGIFVAVIVLGLLLAAVGYLLAQQAPEPTDLAQAVEEALQKRQIQHEIELAGAVSQAEERGRTEILRQVAAQKRADDLADELELSLLE